MDIAAASLSVEETYKLLTGCVVPRPIAWVTTLAKRGHINAAPFSAFTFVSTRPPMVGISIGRKAGKLKDTPRNMLDRREFVVNIGNLESLDVLHQSAQEYPESTSEINELGIAIATCRKVETPRIAQAPIALECTLHQVIDFGETTSFYVGEIVNFYVNDNLLLNGKIDTASLRPICRLGGPHYATLGEIITKQRLYVSPKDSI